MTGVIYEPKGAAREYSELACNLYAGCDHRCGYCYAPGALRMTREAFGSPTPKKTIIERLTKDADRLARQGEQRSILLCFTCDPYQATDEEHRITRSALEILLSRGLKVTILTKGGRRSMRDFDLLARHREQVTYAATLTFTDEADRRTWEPGAAPTEERIEALEEAHGLGIPTWVSLEPVIRPDQSLELIRRTAPFVDLYKVGKWNHAAETAAIDWQRFGSDAIALLEELRKPYYIKDDLRRCLIPAAGGGDGVTGDTKTPGREPMTWYQGEMVPRREVERITRAEAAAPVTAPPPGPAPMPEAVRVDTPDPATVRSERGPGEDPAPAPVTPPRIRSSVPPTLIGIEDIALDIASDRGIWYIGIYRRGEKIADDASRSNPLITKGTAKRIADRVKKEFSHLDRKAVQDAVDRFFEAVREADETITADAVCRVISSIARVEKETSDPPAYVVHLSDGKSMVFSTRDLAALQPITLNERWLAVRDDPLDATGRDFKEIRDHLMAVAVPVDPPGPASPWERTISKLETRIAPLPLESDRSGLKRHGISLEPNGILLIRSDLIQDVIVESGQNPNDGGFARYLKKMGILLVESKPYRIPGTKPLVRAWGVTPDIKDDLTDGLEGSLSEDPVGD